jgi:hypothetical protein
MKRLDYWFELGGVLRQRLNKWPWIILIPIFIGASFLTHGNIIHNPFINFDDPSVIVNAGWRFWDLEQWLTIFLSILPGTELRSLIFFGIYKQWGMDPYYFHAASLITHTLAGISLYFMTERLLRHLTELDHNQRVFAAAFTTILFLVHPINSNVVAWATSLKDNLLGLFTFQTVYWFIRIFEEKRLYKRVIFDFIFMACFYLAWRSKLTALMLPVSLAWLYIFLAWGKINKKALAMFFFVVLPSFGGIGIGCQDITLRYI